MSGYALFDPSAVPLPAPDFFFPPEDAAFVSLAPGGGGGGGEFARQLLEWDARDPEARGGKWLRCSRAVGVGMGVGGWGGGGIW